MYQEDYLLRQITVFFNALKKIVALLEKDEIEHAIIEIENQYMYFNNTPAFFKENEICEIITFIMKQANGIEKIKLLAELYLIASKIDSAAKKQLLKKSIQCFKFYNQNSGIYSFEIISKINQLEHQLYI